jgi:hypothetical protein
VQGANGHLFEVTTQRHETVAACRRVTTGQVRGYAPVGERNAHYCYALMSEQAGAPCLSLYSDRDPDQPVVTEEGAYALVMGSGFYVLANRPAGWGVRVGALDWRLHGHKGARDVRVPSGTVVGLAFAVGVSMAPSLVVLEEDRCALRLIWAEGEREVARSDEPFVSVVVNTASRSMIACLTQSGAVQVYELSQGYGLLATYQNDAGAP